MQTYSQKSIIVEIIDNNGISFKIEGFSTKVAIERAGLPSLDNASVQIYGLSPEVMRKISFVQYRQLESSNYKVNVFLQENSLNRLAFTGNIVNSFPVFQQVPDVYFNIHAISGYNDSLILKTPYSSSGTTKISNVVKDIAKDLGKSFTNNGVDVTDENLYLEGSQIKQLSDLSTNYDYITVLDKNSITISPKDKPTAGTLSIVDCNSGAVKGYIENSQDGIHLSTFYNSNFQLNSLVRVTNSVNPLANGDWVVSGATDVLASRIDGEWNTNLKCSYFKV